MNQAPPLSPTNKIILIALVALFLLNAIGEASAAFSVVGWLGLYPMDWFPVRLYTLVTYPLVETHLMGVLFNGLVLWFLGSELERTWGRALYVRFLLTTLVLAGLAYAVVGSTLFAGTRLSGGVLVGTAGVTYALCVAYAVLYPDREFLMMFVFPVKARWFCLIMAGVELYMGLFSGNPAAWGHIFSMAVGFVLIRFQNWGAIKWWFTARVPQRKKGSGKLRLVEEDDKPKYWH
jgi:membrane associated rhomboid family serine protease